MSARAFFERSATGIGRPTFTSTVNVPSRRRHVVLALGIGSNAKIRERNARESRLVAILSRRQPIAQLARARMVAGGGPAPAPPVPANHFTEQQNFIDAGM